jgi:hypothetical protein
MFTTNTEYNDWHDTATAEAIHRLIKKYGNLFTFDDDGDPTVIPEANDDYTAAMGEIESTVPVFPPEEIERIYTRGLKEMYFVADMQKKSGTYKTIPDETIEGVRAKLESHRTAAIALWSDYQVGKIKVEE